MILKYYVIINFVTADEITSEGEININQNIDIDIYWKWDINAALNTDTEIGQGETQDYYATVELSVEFDQVD